MQRRKICLFVILFGSSVSVSLPVAASDWYIGFQAGSQRTDVGKLSANYQPVFTFTSEATSGKDAYRFSGGRRLLPWLAAELSYTEYATQRLDHFGSRNPGASAPLLQRDTRSATRETDAWGADLVATWPPEGPVYVQGGIGVQRARVMLQTQVKRSANVLQLPSQFDVSLLSTSTVARYTLGAGWRMSEAWSLSLIYERTGDVGSKFVAHSDNGTGKAGQSVVWAGLGYRF